MKHLFLLAALVLLAGQLAAQNVFSVRGTNTYLNDQKIQVVGLRCSNALVSDEATGELIDNLDVFRSYGINTVSVFFQGSRFGDVIGYHKDATLNPAYTGRMAKIIEACDERNMVVLVGCLYYGTTKAKWESWEQEDAEKAIANTVRWLSENDYRNVFLDPDNEGGSGFDISHLIAAGKKINPDIIIGFNDRGYAPPNADIALHLSDVTPGKPYIETEGTTSEYWGEYSKERDLYNYINIGIYTEGKKAEQIRRTDRLLQNGHGYMFASTWLQGLPPKFRPGGYGTHCDPGIKWWLEYYRDNYLNR